MKNRLKILAIGNSFSMDAMEYIYQMARDLHADEIVLGDLYIAGCTLETHWNNAENNLAHYTYYKNVSGYWEAYPSVSIIEAILQEDWDIITLQQGSGKSGNPDTYEPYLSKLIEYVIKNATNTDVKLAWHMTWAYQADSTHGEFPLYKNDQMVMFNAIIDALKQKVQIKKEFSYIIPAGIAIQNARQYFGDILTRDGYHLSIPLGRYIAGLCWIASLTELNYKQIKYLPEGIEQEKLPIIKESVKNSVENDLL